MGEGDFDMQSDARCPVIVPSLASILSFLESIKHVPLSAAEVQAVVSKAPSIVLPVSHRDLLEKARSYSDIDPQSAWEQWQYLRGQMEEQGVPPTRAFPNPHVQLESDLKVIRQIVQGSRLADVPVIEHQLAVLFDLATETLNAWGGEFGGNGGRRIS